MENPEIKITFGDEEFLATPENTSLFNFIAVHSLYNHIFVVREESKKRQSGSFIWEKDPETMEQSEVYAVMREYMLEHGYPAHLNMQDVAECDITAFDNMLNRSVESFETLPEGW